jgi:hypothetical protein
MRRWSEGSEAKNVFGFVPRYDVTRMRSSNEGLLRRDGKSGAL